MKEESLEKASIKIIDIIYNLDIPTIDKLELILNLTKFLDTKEYEENIQILRRVKENGKT